MPGFPKIVREVPCIFSLSFFSFVLCFVSMQHYMPLVLIPLKIINGSIGILEVVAVLSPAVSKVYLK